MILLKVDAISVAVIKLEGQAPRPIDVNGVSNGRKATKCMKIEADEVHIFHRANAVQAIKPRQYTFVQARIDF
jgi:hypothetical protein